MTVYDQVALGALTLISATVASVALIAGFLLAATLGDVRAGGFDPAPPRRAVMLVAGALALALLVAGSSIYLAATCLDILIRPGGWS